MDDSASLSKTRRVKPLPVITEQEAHAYEAPPQPANDLDTKTGLVGSWKLISGMSFVTIVGFLCVYTIVFMIPQTQDKFHDELRSERKAYYEQREKDREEFRQGQMRAIDHGDKAVDKITQAIDRQTEKLSGVMRSASGGVGSVPPLKKLSDNQ